MQLTRREHGICDIISVNGHIGAGDVKVFEEELQHLFDLGRCQVIVDLTDCTYVGSAGLSLWVRFASNFRRWNRGDLYLASVPPYIQGLLSITGLVTEDVSFFRQYETVDLALDVIQDGVTR